MTDQQVFDLGTFIRAYFKRNKISQPLTGREVYELLNRSEKWKTTFYSMYDFYTFLNKLVRDNRLVLLRCCELDQQGESPSQKRWIFYGPQLTKSRTIEACSVPKDSQDLYAYEKNKKANDGTLLRSYQEVYIYNALRKVRGLSVWYEKPIRLGNGRELLPDFTIGSMWKATDPLFWEHFGYHTASYKRRTRDKLMMYRESGIHKLDSGGKLISTYYHNEEQFVKDTRDTISIIRKHFDV